MDEVGELDGILDEENRDVVADQVPVAFLGVKLDGKAAHVRGVSTEPAPPATVEMRVNTGVFSPTSVSILAVVYFFNEVVELEESMHARRSRVNDTLGNALVIEMGDFLAQDEIFQQRGTARIGPSEF